MSPIVLGMLDHPKRCQLLYAFLCFNIVVLHCFYHSLLRTFTLIILKSVAFLSLAEIYMAPLLCLCWRTMFFLLLTLTLGVANAENLFYAAQQQEQQPSAEAISPSNSLACPDRKSTCSGTASCCRSLTGTYRCCTYPNVRTLISGFILEHKII